MALFGDWWKKSITLKIKKETADESNRGSDDNEPAPVHYAASVVPKLSVVGTPRPKISRDPREDEAEDRRQINQRRLEQAAMEREKALEEKLSRILKTQEDPPTIAFKERKGKRPANAADHEPSVLPIRDDGMGR